VVLWFVPRDTQAVIQRQLSTQLPVVLNVALNIPVAVEALGVVVRLNIGVVDTQERVRVGMSRIQGIVRVVVEVYVAVSPRKHRLILATALCVETSLDRMRSNDLGEIVDEVEGVILVDERQSVEVRERKRLIGNAAEPEVRNVTKADVREEFRD